MALAIDPTNPETVYTGDHCCNVFKSIDGGVTWSKSNPRGGDVYALTIDPHNPAIVYAGTEFGVFRALMEVLPGSRSTPVCRLIRRTTLWTG